jgi:folate-dependent tRNA-U54 methylase TrmFO/GidA
MKANFGLLPELEMPPRDKRLRHAVLAARARTDLEAALAAGDAGWETARQGS